MAEENEDEEEEEEEEEQQEEEEDEEDEVIVPAFEASVPQADGELLLSDDDEVVVDPGAPATTAVAAVALPRYVLKQVNGPRSTDAAIKERDLSALTTGTFVGSPPLRGPVLGG